MKNILYFLFLFNLSCHIVKSDFISTPNKCIDFRVNDGNRFSLLYYDYSLDSLKQDFFTGVYVKKDNEFTLYPDTISNTAFDAILIEKKSDFEGKRIKIETKISGDFLSEYITVLHIGTVKYSFRGVKIDTVLNKIDTDELQVQIFLPKKEINEIMKVSFRSIITKKLTISNRNNNNFFIKIPLSREFFFYKNTQVTKITDFGGSIKMGYNGESIKKCKLYQ